jgi:hypothetical protein
MIQVIFQASLFGFFLGLFAISKKLFLNRSLAVSFIVLVVFVRVYAAYYDPTFVFQITPLRLDLWLIPLAFALFLGISHWSVGLSLSLLIVLHHNFGLIYTAAYFQTILFAFMVDFISVGAKKGEGFRHFGKLAFNYLKIYSIPFLSVLSGVVIIQLLTGQFGGNDASKLYRQFGFGFDRVSDKSAFWPLLVLIFYSIGTLLTFRTKISKIYFETSLFIVFLCVGNLIYFLGRSHESNLLWISGSAILLLFIVLDLNLFKVRSLSSTQVDKMNGKDLLTRVVASSLPIFLFSTVTYFYSDQAKTILKKQVEVIQSGKIFSFPNLVFPIDLIKENTSNSDKVFFMSGNDFYYYYYGGYMADSYFIPYPAWVMKSELVGHIQEKIDADFYVVCDDLCESDIIEDLKFSQRKTVSGISFIKK